MNPRIEELAKKAHSYADNIVAYDPENSMVFESKFAELIVKECAGIYDKVDNGNMHMGTYNYLVALQKTFDIK